MKLLPAVVAGVGSITTLGGLRFNPQLENMDFNAVISALDSGGSPGSLELREGDTVLVTLGLSIPSFQPTVGIESVVNTVSEGIVGVSGTPDNFAFVTSNGDFVFGGDIPEAMSAVGALTVNQTVNMSGYTVQQGLIQEREFASTVPSPYI